jgi:hypothetical protein
MEGEPGSNARERLAALLGFVFVALAEFGASFSYGNAAQFYEDRAKVNEEEAAVTALRRQLRTARPEDFV